MITELTLSDNARPSRTTLLILSLMAAGLMAASFAYGRSVLEANDQNNAIKIANENQSFCASLGLGSQTETYRKCIAGLDEIRLHQKERLDLENAGIL
jgi:putative hemolysin